MSIQCQITQTESGHLSRLNTGTGNVLFQLASGYGLAKKYGLEHNCQQLNTFTNKILTNYNYQHRFTIYRNFDMTKSYTPNCILTERNECFALYDENIIANIPRNNTNHIQANGYFQSHTYFNEYKDELIELFKVDPSTLTMITAKYPILFDTSYNCISMHFRTEWGYGVHYHLDYYKEAIELFKQNTVNPHFLVFTDNVETARKILPELAIECTLVEGNPDYMDLWIMSFCKHNILSFSTFSWWGAYLNTNPDKKVYYPHDALRVAYGIRPAPVLTERLTHHYLPEWIPLYSKSIL
jgi:hypothetical protein